MLSPPALLLGLVIAGYWYRVVRMARKARRRAARGANVIPGELIGRVVRLIWGPAIVVWVIHPFVTAFVAQPAPAMCPIGNTRPAAWPAAVVAGLCFAATTRCWRQMGSAWRMGINPRETTQLVVTGPFAYVRHPIYALSAGMMVATLVVLPTPLMLGAGFVHVGLLFWESAREEWYLAKAHGAAYDAYRARVGRFFPASFRPFAPGQ